MDYVKLSLMAKIILLTKRLRLVSGACSGCLADWPASSGGLRSRNVDELLEMLVRLHVVLQTRQIAASVSV